jgi:hypothetical protein
LFIAACTAAEAIVSRERHAIEQLAFVLAHERHVSGEHLCSALEGAGISAPTSSDA